MLVLLCNIAVAQPQGYDSADYEPQMTYPTGHDWLSPGYDYWHPSHYSYWYPKYYYNWHGYPYYNYYYPYSYYYPYRYYYYPSRYYSYYWYW